MDRLVGKLGAVCLAAALLAGCGASKIAYKPMAGSPGAASGAVTLQVVDARPADKGGTDKAVVGQVRGSYGIPSSVKDSAPDVATRTVGDATTDALRQAGVGTQGGSKTLVATIKHYWMDGLTGYKATVTVHYDLKDASGKVLWSSDVSGGAGGVLMFKSAESMTTEMFGNALSDLAQKASVQFKSAEFQKAIS